MPQGVRRAYIYHLMCFKRIKQRYLFSDNKDNECSIESLEEFLKCVDHSNEDVYLYRGHSCLRYKLIPFIGRNETLLNNEQHIFLEFKRKFYLYTDQRPKTDMDLLFLAQHYGIPTRLLDWSYNPLVALYFSCCSNIDCSGSVYVYQIPNQKSCVKEGHLLDNEVFSSSFVTPYHFIIPDYTDRRYINQQGMFLWFRDPKEEFMGNTKKIIIRNKRHILQSLRAIGITESFIYPTLDHLGSEIKNKYSKTL